MSALQTAAIIPLGPGSHQDSSSLPEGFQFTRLAPRKMECAPLQERRSMSRASPPLLFGLAPRGVFRALAIASEAVGSYPTFSPLPTCEHCETSRRFCLRDATVLLRSAGGLIFCGTIRSFALWRSPLALPGTLPCQEFWPTNRWPCLRTVSGLSSRCCALRPSSQRLPGPPAGLSIPCKSTSAAHVQYLAAISQRLRW